MMKMKNPKREICFSLKLLSVTMLLVIFLTGCGGGFGTEPDNYEDLSESIFGPDSL